MRARERRVYEVTDVWVAWVHRQLVAGLDRAPQLVDVGQVELGVDALAEKVHRQRDDVDVARPLTVAEQGALDALGPCHQGQLSGGHRTASIVVRMHAEDEAIPPPDIAVAPLDLVRIDVRGAHLDGRGQIQDHSLFRRWLPHVDDRLGNLLREVELGRGEALG